MKTIQTIIVTFFIALMFTSCDPGYLVEYTIDNQTSGNITVVQTIFFVGETETSSVSSGTQLMTYLDSGIGTTSKNYVKSFDRFPFESLTITNSNGDLSTKDELDSENWSTEYREQGDIGIITLTVTDNDF